MTASRSIATRISFLLLFGLAACGDDESSEINVSGDWSGGSVFGSGFSTSMALSQAGATVTGTIRVSGSLTRGAPLNGNVDDNARLFVWTAFSDCEAWGGTLTVSEDGQSMEGPVRIDRSGCQPPQEASTGTMSLSR